MAVQRLVSAEPTPVGSRPAPYDTSVWNDVVHGSIDSVRVEIDDAFADMKTFIDLNPDEAMRLAGGHSARLSELRVRVMRIEDYERGWKDLRVRELEATLEELREQRANASRLHSARELDWRMESGER